MARTRSSKRHAPISSAQTTAAKRLKPSSTSEETQPKDNSSRLLELPVELLQIILGMVAADSGVVLSRKSTNLLSSEGVLRVSRLLRNEYQSVLNMSASPINTKVENFDFSHIVKFLNRLSERELKALPTTALPTGRRFVITLMPTREINPEPLQRWLLRLDSRTKRGTNMAAEYTLVPRIDVTQLSSGHRALVPYSISVRYQWPILKTLEKWLDKLEDGRLRDEVEKIRAAIMRHG